MRNVGSGMNNEPVGRSAGWVGPVEEYRRNRGTVGRKKIVFIGASYKFVHRVLRDLLLVGGFEDCEVVIHDIDEVPLKLVGDLCEKMARQAGTNIRVMRTLELEEALRGADAALLSITTGGMESDMRSWEVCAKYGIPVGVGDTLGPAALARNLREIPVVIEIARTMERLCPNAVLLNFTNPMSCVTGAIARYSSIPVWGLCHSADELFRYFATIFDVKKSEVAMEIGGVNHQSFVTKLWIRGEERTRDILQASLASAGRIHDGLTGESREARLQQDVCKILGAWPSCGGAHLAEFYRFFFTLRRVEELGLSRELRRIVPGREPLGRKEPPEILRYWAYGPEPVGDMHLLTSEHAHELLWSCFTGEPFTRVLNVINADENIKGLPRDACVEVLVMVAGRKVTGRPITLPTAVHSLVSTWVTIHDLSIRAAVACDREPARQALFLDPHVADMYDIEPMLEDFIQVLKPWLPEKWFGK